MSASTMKDNDTKPISGTFEDSTPLLAHPEELRKRAQEDGFLYFRGLLDPSEVLAVREDIISVLDKHGLIDRRYPLNDAIANMETVNQYHPKQFAVGSVPSHIYKDIQKLQSFHALSQTPKLMNVYNTLFGCETFPHPRNIARVAVPHPELLATPSHQDYTYIQGENNTWTCWLPLGDTPRQLGGLAVLKGSHREGLLAMYNQTGGYAKSGSILCGLDYEWLTVDYAAGDFVTFHSLTVHKALPNNIPGKIRLSCDYRYQPATEPILIEKLSLHPHMASDYGWEDVYEDWTDEKLQYYWKKYQFEYSPFDKSLFDPKEKIC